MKRVLLIAYHYPPSESIGAQRPRGLAKYLAEFGWMPTVLTPADARRTSAEQVVETGYLDIISRWKRRFFLSESESMHEQWGLPQPSRNGNFPFHTRVIQNVRSFLVYPDETKGWTPFARQVMIEMRRRNKTFDAVLSTAHPVTCHLIGSEAKQIFNCPWIADFRDLWTQNSNSATPQLLRPFEQRLEQRTVSQADALVTVSSYLAETLSEKYPNQEVRAIPNGFDPEDFPNAPQVNQSTFSIVHTGQLYEGRRDPTILLRVLAKLLLEGKLERSNIRVYFYGPRESWLARRCFELGLQDVVMFPGYVSRAESLKAQMHAQLLLLLNWNSADSSGVLTGKVFEYLGARRPILLLGGDPGALTSLLTETNTGIHISESRNLERYLMEAYGHYLARGEVPYSGIQEKVAAYSHREMAKKFGEVLDSVVEPARGSGRLHSPRLEATTCK